MSATPKTPSLAAIAKQDVNAIYKNLSREWDLRLPQMSFESPMSRQSRPKSTEEQLIAQIAFTINYLYHKANTPLFAALENFHGQASGLYSGWVYKPNADRGVVPEKTRQRPHPITSNERMELLKCLLAILSNARSQFDRSRQSSSSQANMSARSARRTQPDDSPIAFPFSSAQKPDSKRPLEPFPDIDSNIKKVRVPETKLSGRESLSRLPPPQWNVSRLQNTKTDQVKIVPPKGNENSNLYTTFATNVSSVFSQTLSSTLVNTQATEPEPEPEPEPAIKLRVDPLSLDDLGPKTQSSDFGSSFDPTEVERVWTESFGAKISSQDVPQDGVVDDTVDGLLDEAVVDMNQKELVNSLNEMLPTLPSCLKKAPFFVSYEITRVFLFIQAPISDFTLPYLKEWEVYDNLWNMLKTVPILQGKKFPERCGAKVWEIATKGYIRGFNGVVFAASLRENKKPSEPLLSFQLQPMKLDLTHRLERRFGSDRFFEFEIPDLEGKRYSPTMAKACPNAWDTLKSWLINGDHQLLGRTYKSFFVKIKDRKRKSALKSDAEEDSSIIPFRVFLFATNGYGFVKESKSKNPAPHVRIRMTVEELMNCIRPTVENKHQPYMKLFARTALVLSRNRATIAVERTPSQIRYKTDIRNHDANDSKKTYVMTDGAGRMSLALARKIVFELELSYIPSAFQGRFGEAKGLWIVDRHEDIENDWIELYGEQCKWKRGEEGSDEFDHWSHRTFEVVGHSTPLKSADLNTQFLPLLMHQAADPTRMRKAIVTALEEGLQQSFEELKAALTGPRELRSWVRPTNSSIQERIKTGTIQWRGGLPAKHEDRLNILLDAGFDPRKLSYLMELAKKSLTMRCDDLKGRLNITVGRSTIVYMVPDFQGVLEPNEVYLDFSSFVDNETGLSDIQLEGVDVLVARNPAHYPSDIQRVTAVSKHELRHLKDVIVFSTKGYPSLADKLSGGDYDGDKAWICWDPNIVESFANADVPKVPDLDKDGFIEQDKMTYAQLTKGHSDPTNTFLRASFEFNMHQSLLGSSTAFKENIAYKLRDLNKPELIFLSTLLSNLVDQPKQGFIFTEKHLKKVKEHIIATTGTPFIPQYKDKTCLPNNKNHILDHMIILAHQQTEKLLTDIQDSIVRPVEYDPVLAQFYLCQRKKAKVPTEGSATQEEHERAAQWKLLLDQLNEDVNTIRIKWKGSFKRKPSSKLMREDDESMPEFAPIRDSCFEEFRAIKPHPGSKLFLTWLDNDTESEFGQWALLRASALYATYAPSKYHRGPVMVSSLVWWMAGKQYAFMKATDSGMIPMSDYMYVMLKANTGFVRQLRAHEGEGTVIDIEMRDIDSDISDDA
ncbi:RNA polymerase RNA dependente [Sclerotinia borealis F-4128]|uniref:RNA-dependent RNA polymerase n=1 Tax=Sclerotinia borealis (strain F-4128) TaxID=1432307 RepID=W9CE84_SCLBF|nr:RNA polymerase RNA dependente [Sclerotinia borealis F-4128]